MPKKSKLTAEEINTFHQAMEGTKPFIHKKIRLRPPSSSKVKNKIKENEEILDFNEARDLAPVHSDSLLSYHRPGISHKMLRKLRKGQYNIDAILDLHGMSVEEAEKAVSHFMQQCMLKGCRVVLIIHGKGHTQQMPVLKNKLNHWLRDVRAILAFCSASVAHGSGGALYVLLKYNEDNQSA
jgi:DNA-nicking Smr family endonuclease